MKLQDLPLDGLRPIFELLDPYEIGSLWLVGCVKLQWALSNGRALLKFDFEFDSRFPLRFPRLVSQLSSLERLTIKYDLRRQSVTLPDFGTPELPHNLQYLKWAQISAISDFNRELVNHPTKFIHLHSLHLHQIRVTEASVLNLSHMSALKVLVLLGLRHRATPTDVLILPPNLVDLSLRLFAAPTDWVAALPRSLTRLDLEIAQLVTSFLPFLPPQLLDLSLDYVSSGWPSGEELDNWQALPRSLTSFKSKSNGPVTPSMIMQLPPTLCHLTVTPFRSRPLKRDTLEAIWRAMPSTLKEMGYFFWPDTLSKAFAMALPRSLCQSVPCGVLFEAIPYLPSGIQCIYTVHESYPENQPLVAFPPNLTILQHKIQSAEHVQVIPPSVTELEAIGTTESWTNEMAQFLPEKLRFLTFNISNLHKSAACWSALPKALDCLVMAASSFELAEKEPKLTFLDAKNLPPLLRTLVLEFAIINPDFYPAIPRTLTELDIIVPDLSLTSYETICLLPAISTITISTELPPTSWRPYVTNMPKTTRNFSWLQIPAVHCKWETDLLEQDFSRLPSGIHSVSLPKCPLVPYLSNLRPPKHMQRLRLGASSWKP